jgi:hypothetical protein
LSVLAKLMLRQILIQKIHFVGWAECNEAQQ